MNELNIYKYPAMYKRAADGDTGFFEMPEFIKPVVRYAAEQAYPKETAMADKTGRLAQKPLSDLGPEFLFHLVAGDSGLKFAQKNPMLAKGLTFIGLPSLVGLGIWGIGAMGKKKAGSPLPYLLPLAALGGGLWWLGSKYKLGSALKLPDPSGAKK